MAVRRGGKRTKPVKPFGRTASKKAAPRPRAAAYHHLPPGCTFAGGARGVRPTRILRRTSGTLAASARHGRCVRARRLAEARIEPPLLVQGREVAESAD